MFRSVERHEVDVLLQDHPRLHSGRVDSCLIRDKSHALAAQEVEVIPLKHIDAEFHGVCGGNCDRESKNKNKRDGKSSELHKNRFVSQRVIWFPARYEKPLSRSTSAPWCARHGS